MLGPLLIALFVACPDTTEKPPEGTPAEAPPAMGDVGAPGAPGAPGTPGTPGGPGTPPEGGARPTSPSFQVAAGEGVKVSGTVTYGGAAATGKVKIDFLRHAEGAQFPELLHSVTLAGPGAFEVEAPKDAGKLMVVAFMDANDNGPDPAEPRAPAQEIVVGTAPVTGLTLALTENPDAGDKGKPPITEPAAAPGAGGPQPIGTPGTPQPLGAPPAPAGGAAAPQPLGGSGK